MKLGSNKKGQAFYTMVRRKGKFGKFGRRIKRRRRLIYRRSNAMVVNNMGTAKGIFLTSRRTTKGKKGMNPIQLKNWKILKRGNQRK